jgi:hypothetical protein
MTIAGSVRRLLRSKRAQRRELNDEIDDHETEQFLAAMRGHRKPPPEA